MFGIHDFGVFLVAGFLLNLTPGPDTFYILGRSMAQGRAAGLASVLGIAAGTVGHTLAAALGISALLAASASAFMAIKLAGAAYLIYLGIRTIRTRATAVAIPDSFSSSGFLAIFRQGMITNLLNPKVALFFLAFMPQFISADSTHKFAAFVTLGFSFIGTGTVWCLFLVWASDCGTAAPSRIGSIVVRVPSLSAWVSGLPPANHEALPTLPLERRRVIRVSDLLEDDFEFDEKELILVRADVES